MKELIEFLFSYLCFPQALPCKGEENKISMTKATVEAS